MSNVSQERSGWRDGRISAWHKTLGYDCPAVDLDFLLVEYDHAKAKALIEYKHERALHEDFTNANYRALIDLGDRAHLPVFSVRYADDFSWLQVRAINTLGANQLEKNPDTLTESEYGLFMAQLRKAF